MGYQTLKKRKTNKHLAKSLAIDFTITCIGIVTLIISSHLNSTERLKTWQLIFAFLVLLYGAKMILEVYWCNVTLSGVCTKMREIAAKPNYGTYTPIFKYSYQGKDYEGESTQTTHSGNSFQVGQTYPIYINAKNPDHVLFRKEADIVNWMELGLGLIIIIRVLL